MRLRWATTVLRIAFGLVWAADAYLKWQPDFMSGFLGLLTDAAKGQPSWLGPWFEGWIRLISISPTGFAYLTAIIETLTALALILGFARRPAYLGGLAFSLLVWGTAEGFGGPYTAASTDVGAGIVYALLFVALYLLEASVGPSSLSVDSAVGRRVSWWPRLAEPGGRGYS